MTDIVEGRLLFRFPDDWHALKYDDENGFVARNCRIPDTKRVDIVAANEDRLLLIEVKDFRGHAIENRGRLDPEGEDSLHIEVARKVRDTFAFLVAAQRGENEALRPFYRYALDRQRKRIDVILFLEEDQDQVRRGRRGASRTDIENRIQRLLRPFNVRCHVQRRHTMPPDWQWTVHGAPGGVGP